jgi:hypothetical protein
MNLFFDGAGWLFPFNFGVAQYIRKHRKYKTFNKIGGLSAGSATALFLLLNTDFQAIFDFIFDNCKKAEYNPFQMIKILENVLQKYVPTHICDKINDKLCIHLSKYNYFTLRPCEVTQFESRDKCLNYVKGSCHIPVVCGLFGSKIDKEIFYDGGLTLDLYDPKFDKTTIVTVNKPNIKFNLISPGFSLPQLWVYFPQSKETMQLLFDLGYQKAREHFEKKEVKETSLLIQKLQKIKNDWFYKNFLFLTGAIAGGMLINFMIKSRKRYQKYFLNHLGS